MPVCEPSRSQNDDELADRAISLHVRVRGAELVERIGAVERHCQPLAFPLILAGIRLATLAIIAIGTIAFLVGAGGLGKLLFEGATTSNPQKILAGSTAVAVLAVCANSIFRLFEWRIGRMIHGEERRMLV